MNEEMKLKLSQYVTYGKNIQDETAEVVLYDPIHNFRKVIVNKDGQFEDFPGIVKGKWTACIKRNFDFDAGQIQYRTSFATHENGYRCFWMIQPDGRYWADDDGFGAENDSEIILYADIDSKGVFKGPFRIYEIDGERIEEPEDQNMHESKHASDERTIEQCTKNILNELYAEIIEEMPDTGDYKSTGFGFSVPNSSYIAIVGVNSLLTENDKIVLKGLILLKGTNLSYTYYYEKLSREEMKEYIRSEEAVKVIADSVRQILEK